MQRSSLLAVVLVLVVSTLLLSALFDNLTGYYENPFPPDEVTPPHEETEHPRLVFAVSPAYPAIYWRISTVDYYDGFTWSSTTTKTSIEQFPKFENDSNVQVFSVEMNTTEEEVSLPVPSSKTSVSNLVLSAHIDYELRLDDMADVYGIRIPKQDNETRIVYRAIWHPIDYNDIDERLVSLDNVPQEVRSIYLQLPLLPEEVWELAEGLKHNSYNILDQILADVQYLRTYFDYDVDLWKGRTQRVINMDWVYSYMQWKKGTCLDAATALAVILRCQGIPARVSFGFKPETTRGNKTYYYSTRAHAETEAYLPPYGWVGFDATPLLADSPRLEVAPIKAEGYPGEDVFYHLKVTNKRNITYEIKTRIYGKENWHDEVIPEKLVAGPFETSDALIKITVPEDASPGETNVFTVYAWSLHDGQEFSVTAVTGVEKSKRVPTVTKITSVDQFFFRGDPISVEGELCTEDNESVHDVRVFVLLSETSEEKNMVIGKSFSSIGHFWIDCQVPLRVGQGTHSLVAVALGDSKHAPSFSLSTIVKVCARTSLKLDVKSPSFVGDQPTILGHLLFDDGAPVPNASITLETNFQDNSSINWKWQTFTDANGFFFTIYGRKFMHPGFFELNAIFAGDKYIGGSNATQAISVVFGTPTIMSLTESCLVRGEVCIIRGKVYWNYTGIWGEAVKIALDGHLLSTVMTDATGMFSYVYGVNPEEELGKHALSFVIQSRSMNLSQEVNIMAKTEFKITSSKKVSGKEQLSLSASLLDDHGLPVTGADLFIENYGLAGKTDGDGNVRFLLDTVRFLPESISLTLHFKGSDIYLATATSVTVVAKPVTPIMPLFSVVIFATVFLALVTNRSLLYRKTIKVMTTTQQEKQKTFLRISFPDIRNSFPNVWGVGEKLRVVCLPKEEMRKKAEGRTVELFVNGKKTARSIISKGCAAFSQIFWEKGFYQVMIRLIDKSQSQTITAEATLRVVDYREEIISLYKAFLRFVYPKFVEIKDEMTAREIESLLLSAGEFYADNLQKVTDCFELTEYSLHSIERKHYETFYQSLRELKFDATKSN